MRSFAALLACTSSAYETDFAAYDADSWKLDTGCRHCSGGAGLATPHPDECTQNSAEAASFGPEGLRITTKKLAQASSCGGECESAHIEYTHSLTYGKFTARAIWFPEEQAPDTNSSATGFLGLDSAGNKASITFGFHGKGWKKYDGSHMFQTGIYPSPSDKKHGETIEAGVSLAEEHEFSIHWHPDKVLWYMDGKVMRKELNASVVPQIPMRLRLHSRSGYCSELGSNDSFTARFTYFEYTPYSEIEQALV